MKSRGLLLNFNLTANLFVLELGMQLLCTTFDSLHNFRGVRVAEFLGCGTVFRWLRIRSQKLCTAEALIRLRNIASRSQLFDTKRCERVCRNNARCLSEKYAVACASKHIFVL